MNITARQQLKIVDEKQKECDKIALEILALTSKFNKTRKLYFAHIRMSSKTGLQRQTRDDFESILDSEAMELFLAQKKYEKCLERLALEQRYYQMLVRKESQMPGLGELLVGLVGGSLGSLTNVGTPTAMDYYNALK